MNDILEATRTHLLSQTAVTLLVGQRIYFDQLPQSATLPALVLELPQSEVADRHLAGGGSVHRAGVNVYCYGATRGATAAVASAVFDAIDWQAGTWGSVPVRRALVEHMQDVTDQPRDGSAAWRFVRALFAIVWHE